MPSTIREVFGVTRQAIGKRGMLAVVLILVLAAPFILAFIIVGFVLAPLQWIVARTGKALSGAGKRLDDPVFGPVVYQGYSTWHAHLNLEALGGHLLVEVPGTHATGPSHKYADLWRGLVEHQQDIARQAETSIFREYQTLAPELRKQFAVGNDWLSESFLKAVPILEKPAQIWPLLSEGSITLDEELEQPGSFSISWECTWGIEYGDVTRRFVNWQLEEDDDG